MENNQKINLLSQRDFGDIYNVVFDFIRQNLGEILKGLIILIPVFIVGTIPLISMQTGLMDMLANNMSDPSDVWAIYGQVFTPSVIIGYIILCIVGMVLPLYPLCYVILYTKSVDTKIEISEVWKMVSKMFLPMLLCNIIAGILLLVGTIMCIIPGIIVGIFIIYYPYAYVSENAGILGSFEKSFQLVKNNWWYTFLTVLLTIIIMFLMSIVFAIPNYISAFSIMFGSDIFSSPIVSCITTTIAFIGNIFSYSLFAIVVGAMYYNRLASTGDYGMEQQIENIGSNNF